jgi:hypothetical protein
MPPREVERLADAIWRTLRPNVVSWLDAALTPQQDSDPGDELSPDDEARVDAWAVRHRQRTSQQQQGQGNRCRTTPKRKAQ